MANDKEKYGLDDEIEFDEVEVWSERSQHLFQVKSADSLPEHAVLKGYFRKYFQLDMYTERVVETLWEVFRQIMKNMPDSNINLRLTTLLEDLTAKMADTASEFAFVVKSKCESSETSAKCQASVMLENTEAVLDSLKTELRHMEAALRSALLIVSANKRISELRNKIANSKSSTNKLKEERQSLEEGEIDAGKRKRMAAINKTLEENAKNMRDWMERISELNQQIIGIETMFAEDKQEENDKYSTGLSTLFGAELMTPDLRAKVGELFAKPLCEVDFFVEYPAQIKAESVAPTSSKRFKKDTGARQYADAALSRLPDSRSITNDLHNINRHNAGPSSKVKQTRKDSRFAVQIALLGGVLLGAASLVEALQTQQAALRQDDNTEYVVNDKSFKEQVAAARAALRERQVPEAKIEEILKGVDSDVALASAVSKIVMPVAFDKSGKGTKLDITVRTNEDFVEAMREIFGEQSNVTLLASKEPQAKQGDALSFEEFCDQSGNYSYSMLVHLPSGIVLSLQADAIARKQLCGALIETLQKKYGVRIEKNAQGKVILQMEAPNTDSPKALNEAKQELRGFIKAMQTKGIVSAEADVAILESAKSLTALEKALLSIMGDAVMTERHPSKIQTAFFVSPEVRTGLSLIRPQAQLGVLDAADKENMRNIVKIQNGVGTFSKQICSGSWAIGLVTSPEDKPESRVFHPYSLENWRSKNCR